MRYTTNVLLLLVLVVFAACSASTPASTIEAVDKDQAADTSELSGDEIAQETEVSEAETSALPVVTVYKSPTCGCCNAWVEHMEEVGFVVDAFDTNDLPTVKADNHVPSQLQSCHTAIVDGYVIEGHVPAEDIRQLLAERPAVTGLAVPGMPINSPGMEIEGQSGQPFDVIAFDQEGNTELFNRHNEE